MQRDDGKRGSMWRLLFPLLLSLCILILRSRLKPSPVVAPADRQGRQVVPEGASTGGVGQREVFDGEGVVEREDEKPDEDSEEVYVEQVVEIVKVVEVGGEDAVEIAENGQGIENEEVGEEEEGGSEVEAYCVKCRQKRSMEDPREIETKNGRHALEGTCPVCGTHLFRFVAR